MKKLWFAEAAKYNGLPLADLNILETLTRSRPYLVGERITVHVLPEHRRGRESVPRWRSGASHSRCWPR